MNPRFEFDPSKHEYKLDGLIIPHVTGILRETGIINLDPYGPAFYGNGALERGRIVHKILEFEDKFELDYGSVDERLFGYLEGWRSFKKDVEFIPKHIETPLFHPAFKYACTIDRIGTAGGLRHTWVVEIKTGKEDTWHAIQLAGQELIVRANDLACKTDKLSRINVLLDGIDGYKIKTYSDPQDYDIFMAALTVANWRKNHGK